MVKGRLGASISGNMSGAGRQGQATRRLPLAALEDVALMLCVDGALESLHWEACEQLAPVVRRPVEPPTRIGEARLRDHGSDRHRRSPVNTLEENPGVGLDEVLGHGDGGGRCHRRQRGFDLSRRAVARGLSCKREGTDGDSSAEEKRTRQPTAGTTLNRADVFVIIPGGMCCPVRCAAHGREFRARGWGFVPWIRPLPSARQVAAPTWRTGIKGAGGTGPGEVSV